MDLDFLSLNVEVTSLYDKKMEANKENLFQAFELVVILTLFGSFPKLNQFFCWLKW